MGILAVQKVDAVGLPPDWASGQVFALPGLFEDVLCVASCEEDTWWDMEANHVFEGVEVPPLEDEWDAELAAIDGFLEWEEM